MFRFLLFVWCCSLLSVANIGWLIRGVDCGNGRTFEVRDDQFYRDGHPFRYVSGSMHYFQVPRPYWRDRFKKMVAGGLNALQTYIEWSSHEPEPGVYDFTGQNDFVEYINEAQQEGLAVILRIGPFICAERDMGGLPYWLLAISGLNPARFRTSDPKFLTPVDRWLDKLLPLVKPLLYQNGGPVIMVQVENEYGSFGSDMDYKIHLRDKFRSILGPEVILFTTDGCGDYYIRRGQIPGTLATVDFGAGMNITEAIDTLRRHQQRGPFVNSEYYVGWFDYWEKPHHTANTVAVCKTLNEMLAQNASVNLYMYHGGTNAGFKVGADQRDDKRFGAITTSYDFDAPITEAGDLTDKYYAIKRIIEQYLPTVANSGKRIAAIGEKMELAPVPMAYAGSMFDHLPADPVQSDHPLPFEDVGLANGFLLYETELDFHPTNPAVLTIPVLRDRAHVFVDGQFQGILSRTKESYQVSILASNGSMLQILVENQGRIAQTYFNQKKGIISSVQINNGDGGNRTLKNWTIYRLYRDWPKMVSGLQPFRSVPINFDRWPSFYLGNFTVPDRPGYPADTFLRLDGWSKGVAWLNGHNLGRYWPAAGPQITLYAPGVYFRKPGEQNRLVLLELDDSPCWPTVHGRCEARFFKTHIINGTYPTSA